MAIVSVGYDGAVSEAQWAQMVSKVGSSSYGVVGSGDWKVSTVPATDRGVSIAAGAGWGAGVYDISDGPVVLQAEGLTSETYRWDMVVAQRDWSGTGGSTTFKVVKGLSSGAQQLPIRAKNPGTLDDQPIALIQLQNGKTQVQQVVDLRCWAANGGMVIADPMAMGYLDAVGSTVFLGNTEYARTFDANGNPIWSIIAGGGRVGLFGVGPVLQGTAGAPEAAGAGGFLIQAGTTTATTDSNGAIRITWPKPFPNGLLTVTPSLTISSYIQPGENGVLFGITGNTQYYGNSGDKNSVVCQLLRGPGPYSGGQWTPNPVPYSGVPIRVNWIAIGW